MGREEKGGKNEKIFQEEKKVIFISRKDAKCAKELLCSLIFAFFASLRENILALNRFIGV
jgi:hypothetical protein